MSLTALPLAIAGGIDAAVDDSSRPEEHRVRDAGRKPKEILNLIGLAPGDVVAELAAGSGYYAAIVSPAVGERGKVYAVDPKPILEAFPDARETFPRFQSLDPRDNIVYSVQNMDSLRIPKPLDHALMILCYHDTIWTGEDRETMNRTNFAALKPGGQFLLVDHHGEPGRPTASHTNCIAWMRPLSYPKSRPQGSTKHGAARPIVLSTCSASPGNKPGRQLATTAGREVSSRPPRCSRTRRTSAQIDRLRPDEPTQIYLYAQIW